MSDKSRNRADWPLTARQMDCLERFSSRKSAKEIGKELGITHHSVEKHLGAARIALGASTSVEAARMVFGDPGGLTVKPYYDASEVHPEHLVGQARAIPGPQFTVGGMTGERDPINTFGPIQTLLLILGVALGLVLSVAALVAAAQGATQLWSGLLH